MTALEVESNADEVLTLDVIKTACISRSEQGCGNED
jgi:hypothetical protein